MARATKLKVYRTPIGFHDAYVAAPSQKAALAAWGSDADLFARGVAERVDDPELAREPLEKPGTVIRRSRGTTAEQLAALPPDRPRKKEKPPKAPSTRAIETSVTPKAKPKPRPKRDALDAAEAAMAAAKKAFEDERDHLIEEERRLARDRRLLEERYNADRRRLEDERSKAETAYAKAMKAWRGE